MTRARLFGALLLVSTLLAAAAPPVEADPTFSIGATTVTPNPVQPGVTIAIRTSITNTSATVASGLIIDEEIWDAAGVKVNQGTSSGPPASTR